MSGMPAIRHVLHGLRRLAIRVAVNGSEQPKFRRDR
jgi:hypothetical protein